MASARYVVKDSQKTRGAGAKFIVRWESESMTNPLMAQGLMISTASQLGISFTTEGIVVEEQKKFRGCSQGDRNDFHGIPSTADSGPKAYQHMNTSRNCSREKKDRIR